MSKLSTIRANWFAVQTPCRYEQRVAAGLAALDTHELNCYGEVNAAQIHTRSIVDFVAKEDIYVPAAFREPRQGTMQSRY
jgi:hypothetical protein